MPNNSPIPANNGAIVTISQIIKALISSALESGLGSLFIKCKESIPVRHTLKSMGHKQPPTPMQPYNTTAHGVLSNKIASKRLKSMDMILHWHRCRISQKQFFHYWQPEPNNLGDYVTKHHAVIHHKAVCGTYLTQKHKLDLFEAENARMNLQQGCVRLTNRYYQAKGPTDPFIGTNTGFHIPRGLHHSVM